jgi:hypothetical protein
MRIEPTIHQPKGGMCTNCEQRFADCSGLPFHEMQVITKPINGMVIVRCTEYAKDNNLGE